MNRLSRLLLFYSIGLIPIGLVCYHNKADAVEAEVAADGALRNNKLLELVNRLSGRWEIISDSDDVVVAVSESFQLKSNDKFCSRLKIFVNVGYVLDQTLALFPVERRVIYALKGGAYDCSSVRLSDFFDVSFSDDLQYQALQGIEEVMEKLSADSGKDDLLVAEYLSDDVRRCIVEDFDRLVIAEASARYLSNDGGVEIIVGFDRCSTLSPRDRLFALYEIDINGDERRMKVWRASARQH